MKIKQVLKEVEGLFNEREKTENKKEVAFIDKSNVYMFIVREPKLKKQLSGKYEPTEKIPTLDYVGSQTVKISADYLTRILTIIKKSKTETVELTVKNEYPLKIECAEFSFIIAPRIEE